MKARHTSFVILLLTFVFALPTPAQKMTVKSMVSTNDQTANLSENLHKDQNGDYGGLVKVYLAANAVFDGVVLEQTKHSESEYWVFMAKGSSHLKVTVSGYNPLEVNFRDYGIEGIESRHTYVLSILLPQPSSTLSNTVASSTSSIHKETFTVNDVSFTMVRVDGGTFTMGATEEQGNDAQDDEKLAHEVTLSTFMIGETEVTQTLWQAVMGNNPSHFNYYPELPVENVSWNDCKKFIKKLNQMTGKSFRLPTEAEWEYAARGGNRSKHKKYSGSNTLEDVAWSHNTNIRRTLPVKKKFTNELGLFDMSGNVYEWCEDKYDSDYYKSSPKSNPTGPSSGSKRVCRGGSWATIVSNCRVSSRGYYSPGSRYSYIGLRLAM